MNSPTPLSSARWWKEQGFSVFPIPHRQKKPELKGWPSLELTLERLPEYFGSAGPGNLGVVLGDEHGSADIDLDCQEAVVVGAVLLPETRLIFGRASRPASHYFYRSDPPVPSRKYLDPLEKEEEKTTIVELRCRKKDGTRGFQTIVPFSTHPSGELIRFESGCDGPAGNVDADELQRGVARVAAASLFARHWPKPKAGRNDAFLALAGILVRAGWTVDAIIDFNFSIYRVLWGPQADRVACASEVRPTFEKHALGAATTGVPKLKSLLDERVVKAGLGWLGIGSAPTSTEEPTGKAKFLPGAQDHVETAAGDWHHSLIRGKNGDILAVLANAITALRVAPDFGGVLAFDEFSLSVVVRRPIFGGCAGAAWTDHEDRLLANWLHHERILVSVETAGQAAQVVARDSSFHPVRDYLKSLSWDGTKRADGWLSLYLGVEPNDYTRAIGERYLRSAVARIMQPGCKADCCLILEGEQGIKKSTALKVLAQPWFTDEIADLGSKDAALQTRGVWLIEIAELDGMTRSEVGKIKAFMSRAVDRFRPPYGRHLLESPRQCVFAGSVNHGAYLRDPSGGRRFWPVMCTRILIDELARDRDMLWAEAVASYQAGAVWWLETQELNQKAEEEQSQRYEETAWDGLILSWAAERIAMGNSSVSVAEVLDLCITKRTGDWSRSDEMRVGSCLSKAKWKRYRDRKLNMQWRYRPPVPTCAGGNTSGNSSDD